GSIGWIDEGGLLRMGPQSAGADPGPACYMKGGTRPTTTDANLVLGYLDPAFFAGGKMQLDVEAARTAIETHIAKPLGLTVEEAAAGMYRIACTNMAQGVREITITRGSDPREFPMVVAGGAGPIHSCLICDELEIPLQVVPRESSVLCAVGMLMSDLKHDFVRTFVARFDGIDWDALETVITDMRAEGDALLAAERIPADKRRHHVKFDCRYLKQYHEVSFEVSESALKARDLKAIATAFHAEHNRLYGYSLEEENTPVEIINVRVQSLGLTEKPSLMSTDSASPDASAALKGKRPVYVFEDAGYREIPIYDGHRLQAGNRIAGPALIESVTTAVYISASFDCLVDRYGSFALYRKGREDLLEGTSAGGSQ
ncbi:MAG: hydantoinase/oxoprolinase family protein, partial [Hyphomicrobiales bacterium]|nr:hydantoinase/oxoprolinase family protein [Hyphomicrobiales bacterium]